MNAAVGRLELLSGLGELDHVHIAVETADLDMCPGTAVGGPIIVTRRPRCAVVRILAVALGFSRTLPLSTTTTIG